MFAQVVHTVDQYVKGLVVLVDFSVITQLPLEEGRGQQAVCLCLSVSKPISPSWGERKEGVTWQDHSYYEIVGLHFNSTWPCQGHHMPACLPGLLETRCYWTKAAAPHRHTQQLFSVAAYHLMTLTEGKATHDWRGTTPTAYGKKTLANNADTYHEERNRNMCQ